MERRYTGRNYKYQCCLISQHFRQKFHTQLKENNNSSVSALFQMLCINEVNFQAEDITWQSSSAGINCKVFRVGSTGWQPGKLRIKVSTEIFPPSNKFENYKLNITVMLEFYPDNPNEPESPLDDIRKMMQVT
ncbi:KGK domain-containing protein [Nostoc sp.]|uniref:KGK domain-containing protein n=1 Tax=Nostoc sp. TaxID=1180 RepID=UPI002FF70B3F